MLDDDGALYVVSIDAASHTVLVGPQSALACKTVYLDDMNWISPNLLPSSDMMEKGIAIFAKLRNTAPASSARLFMEDGQRVRLELDAPEYGVARGQAGVIYDATDNSLMLGGGWIANAPTISEIIQTEITVSA